MVAIKASWPLRLPARAILAAFPSAQPSSGLSWNRHSQLVAAIARRFFGIPCCAYFDDYDICGPSWAAASAKCVLRQIHVWLGIPLAEGLKDVPPREINPFLGVITDLSDFSRGFVTMRSKPERIAKLLLSIDRFMAEGIPGSEAKTFFGKLEFVRSSGSTGRVGRAAIGILRRWVESRSRARDDTGSIAELVLEALLFLAFLLPRLPQRRVHCCGDRHSGPPIILYTDAMYEAKATPPARIGVALYDPLDEESPWRDLSAEVPAHIIASWTEREQYITQLEALAPLVAALSRPNQLRGRDVICFVDNTGALFGLGKGDCKDADCARMEDPRTVPGARYQRLVRVRRVRGEPRRSPVPGGPAATHRDGQHALFTRRMAGPRDRPVPLLQVDLGALRPPT